METTLPVVEITVKAEPIECENSEENQQNENSLHTIQITVKEEELWIKPEPREVEDESQDSIKDEDLATLSENEAKVDEEALNNDLNRNRQSNAPSRKQIMVFLDFLNEHRDLANCMLRGVTGRPKAHQLWEDITERLNKISGCYKTTQQWQRVWSDKKYLTKKAAAARFAFLTTGGPHAPKLTLQDEKILTILGESITPWRVGPKPATPEPKLQTSNQPQEVIITSGPPKRGSAKVELEPHSTMPDYTPRKEVLRISDVPQSDVPPSLVIPFAMLQQPDVTKPPDELPNLGVENLDESPPSSSITGPPTPPPRSPEQNRQSRVKLRAGQDPYTKKFIHLEEERLKSDARRNTELTEIGLSLQQGTAELKEIRKVMQEMLGLMKQFTERDSEK